MNTLADIEVAADALSVEEKGIAAADVLPECSPVAQDIGVHVRRDGARFLIRMQMAVNAPPSAVFRALTDYATLARYNPDLRAVRVEPTAEPNHVRVFATIHICVLFFCICASGRLPTCMDIQIELVPAFSVPPVIGPRLIRRKMYEEAQRTGAGLEQVARG